MRNKWTIENCVQLQLQLYNDCNNGAEIGAAIVHGRMLTLLLSFGTKAVNAKYSALVGMHLYGGWSSL